MQAIKTVNAPEPIGPYSQAVIANGLLFVSGQIGIDPTTGEMHIDLELQARQVMENIKAILTEAKLDFSKVVKSSIFLMDMNHFSVVNMIYGSYFSNPYPARETVQVAALPKNALVEISVVATL